MFCVGIEIFGKTRSQSKASTPHKGIFGCWGLCQFDTSAADSRRLDCTGELVSHGGQCAFFFDPSAERQSGRLNSPSLGDKHFPTFSSQCPDAQSDDGFSHPAAKLTHLLAAECSVQMLGISGWAVGHFLPPVRPADNVFFAGRQSN